jgi:NAD dependent epimerase/dehydratase family enzyme
MSWIHRDDEIGIIEYLLNNPDGQGIYNLTAPNPVSNAEFTRTLAEVLHRPAVFRVPALLLRWMLGERAELLLGSQNVRPERLLALGYAFRYPHLKPALN